MTLAVGQRSFTLTHQYLDDNPTGTASDVYTISVALTDQDGGRTSQSTTTTVNNVAPTATLSTPPTAVRGQDVTFTGTLNDIGTLDTLQVSWNFGDGTVLPFQSVARGGVSAVHAYAAVGTYTITLTVKDDDGGQSSISTTVNIQAIATEADPCEPGKTALFISGTDANDAIKVAPNGSKYEIFFNNVSQGLFAPPTDRIIVYALGGDDDVQISGSISTPTLLIGGTGNDRLNGGKGLNVIVGGPGNDTLNGGSDRDILIGGDGADTITGNGGDDILIAGTTAYDTQHTALCALMDEWGRTDKTYAQRVADLLNGGGLNGTTTLNANAVFDDRVSDTLSGSAGTDWFFARQSAPAADTLTDRVSGETITAPGTPPSPLFATTVGTDSAAPAVTDAQLASLTAAAKAYWQELQLTSQQQELLSQVVVRVDDLDGAMLGQAKGTTVTVDINAAGHGWFVDMTPYQAEEFSSQISPVEREATTGSPANGRMDLLTVLAHEIGHILGFSDVPKGGQPSVMTDDLPTGVRRTPSVVDLSAPWGHDDERRTADLTTPSVDLSDFDGSFSGTADSTKRADVTMRSWLKDFVLNTARHREKAHPDVNADFEVAVPTSRDAAFNVSKKDHHFAAK